MGTFAPRAGNFRLSPFFCPLAPVSEWRIRSKLTQLRWRNPPPALRQGREGESPTSRNGEAHEDCMIPPNIPWSGYTVSRRLTDAEVDSARDFEEPIEDVSFPIVRGPL